MYVTGNPKTQDQGGELKRRLAAGERVEVFAPGLGTPPTNGKCSVEGPHYPKPHTWYGEVTVVNGVVTKVV